MSPLKVERESISGGKEIFSVPQNGRYVLEFVGGRRVTMYGTFFGGRLETIPDIRHPEAVQTANLAIFERPVIITGRHRNEKDISTYTISAEI